MLTLEQKCVVLRAIDHFGTEHQIKKAIEEMGELTVELSRYLMDLEKGTRRTGKELIRGELADVMIMAEQLRIIFGQAEVDAAVEDKIKALWMEKMRLPVGQMPIPRRNKHDFFDKP